jgi:hypothetical protein
MICTAHPILCVYSHTTATRMIPAYTKCDVQLIKVAPDDGLTYSETCRASNEKIKSNHKNSVHLVGLYTNRWYTVRNPYVKYTSDDDSVFRIETCTILLKI